MENVMTITEQSQLIDDYYTGKQKPVSFGMGCPSPLHKKGDQTWNSYNQTKEIIGKATLPRAECYTNRVSLRDRIERTVDRWMHNETARRLGTPKVVWTERAIVALTIAGAVIAGTLGAGIPLAIVGGVLGICLIAYTRMRLQIKGNVNGRFEKEKTDLLTLEQAMAARGGNQSHIKTLMREYLESLSHHVGLNPRDANAGPEPEFDSLSRLIEQIPDKSRRELLKDIVIGPKNDDRVLNTTQQCQEAGPKTGREHDEYGIVKRLVKNKEGRKTILENKRLTSLFLGYCVENAGKLSQEEKNFYGLLIELQKPRTEQNSSKRNQSSEASYKKLVVDGIIDRLHGLTPFHL